MANELPDELVIKLRKPVKLGEITFTEISLREPTAAQWLEWDGLKGVEADVKAIAIVSGMPEPAVKMIGARDFIQATRFLAAFLD